MWAGGTTNSTVPLESFLSTISLFLRDRERESFLNNKLGGEAEGGEEEEEEEEEKGGGGGGGGGEHRIDNRIGLRLRERERDGEVHKES